MFSTNFLDNINEIGVILEKVDKDMVRLTGALYFVTQAGYQPVSLVQVRNALSGLDPTMDFIRHQLSLPEPGGQREFMLD